MVEGSTLALAGIGGLVAAEATGITNFSGGGSNREDPLPPTLPGSGGPSFAEIRAFAEAAGGTGETATRVINTGGGGAGLGAAMASAFSQMQQSQNRTLQTVLETTQGGSDAVTRYIPTNIPGAGPDSGTPSPGSGRREGPGGFGLTARQRAAAMTGRDPFGLQATTEGPVATAAEVLRAGGKTATDIAGAPTDAVNWAGKSGRTFGEAFDLVTTGKADTSGTFAEDRGMVQFDFSGDGEAGGKLTDRIPDFNFGLGNTTSEGAL